MAAARARTRVRPERAGAPALAGARPGARVALGEGRRLHAPALRQSPTVAAAAPRWLRNAAAPHNHGVRGHGSGLRFPALLGNGERTSGGPRWRNAASLSTLGCVRVCRGGGSSEGSDPELVAPPPCFHSTSHPPPPHRIHISHLHFWFCFLRLHTPGWPGTHCVNQVNPERSTCHYLPNAGIKGQKQSPLRRQ